MHPRTAQLMLAGAAGLSLAVVGCGSSHREAASIATRQPSPTVSPPRIDRVVSEAADFVRPYFVPTVSAFAAGPLAKAVVVGEVLDVRAVARKIADDGALDLTSVVTLRVTNPNGEPVVVRFSERGGIVRMRQVRSDFEDKRGARLTEKQLDQWVDYRSAEFPHSRIGQRVVVILGGPNDGVWYRAASLVADANGTYSWPDGIAPNPAWKNESVTSAVVDRWLTQRPLK